MKEIASTLKDLLTDESFIDFVFAVDGFQFCQGGPRLNAGFQDNLGFDILRGRERRQIVESAIRLKRHAETAFTG